ncbi:14192_t:CDS:2 [Funneliformis mosseae]|uniref:14192_t:CDS:1 n=1 Tax=Funneliformis mosseae TaxID=27381 RepID=A0A9N9A3M3_FUNMO|nr:14192_t:CDS:2 [Funneliformis mosseae]
MARISYSVELIPWSLAFHKGSLLLNPPSKQYKNFNELVKFPHEYSLIVTYRDRLRDVLLEVYRILRYLGWQQMELILQFETETTRITNFRFWNTNVVANIAVPKYLMDRFIKLQGNSLLQKSLGLHGDSSTLIFRLIPIEQEPGYENKSNSNELHYRVTLNYSYPTKLDDVESDKIKVDDNDSASVIVHVKQMIRNFRSGCEFDDIILELWDLVPKSTPNDPEKFQFKTYNPTLRRPYQDINPSSIQPWTSS